MKWPFVSRTKYLEDQLAAAQQQIDDLIAVNEDLRLIALGKGVQVEEKKDEDPLSSRPHRKMGADLRAEFSREARLRQAASGKKT